MAPLVVCMQIQTQINVMNQPCQRINYPIRQQVVVGKWSLQGTWVSEPSRNPFAHTYGTFIRAYGGIV